MPPVTGYSAHKNRRAGNPDSHAPQGGEVGGWRKRARFRPLPATAGLVPRGEAAGRAGGGPSGCRMLQAATGCGGAGGGGGARDAHGPARRPACLSQNRMHASPRQGGRFATVAPGGGSETKRARSSSTPPSPSGHAAESPRRGLFPPAQRRRAAPLRRLAASRGSTRRMGRRRQVPGAGSFQTRPDKALLPNHAWRSSPPRLGPGRGRLGAMTGPLWPPGLCPF